jgi:N-acyl amino acid synthase of PEP-CTERM/exosortase system
MRRLVPHLSLGLFRGIARLAADQGVKTLCAAMAPALLRLLERFSVKFDVLGEPVEYHGLRQPCVAECAKLLAGLSLGNSDYYNVVRTEYLGAPSAPAKR